MLHSLGSHIHKIANHHSADHLRRVTALFISDLDKNARIVVRTLYDSIVEIGNFVLNSRRREVLSNNTFDTINRILVASKQEMLRSVSIKSTVASKRNHRRVHTRAKLVTDNLHSSILYTPDT